MDLAGTILEAVQTPVERFGLAAQRAAVVALAGGRVLEVAGVTGRTVGSYVPGGHRSRRGGTRRQATVRLEVRAGGIVASGLRSCPDPCRASGSRRPRSTPSCASWCCARSPTWTAPSPRSVTCLRSDGVVLFVEPAVAAEPDRRPGSAPRRSRLCPRRRQGAGSTGTPSPPCGPEDSWSPTASASRRWDASAAGTVVRGRAIVRREVAS